MYVYSDMYTHMKLYKDSDSDDGENIEKDSNFILM